MEAAATDKLRKLSRKWVGQIGAGGVSDAVGTTIPLASTTNLPTDTAVTLVIDRVDSSGAKTPALEETIVGVVSGTNIIDCIRGVEGTAQAHIAGAVVEVLVTAAAYNDLIDAFMVAFDQSGALKSPTTLACAVLNTQVTGTALAVASEVASGVLATKVVTPKSLTDAGFNISASSTSTFTNKTLVQKVTAYNPDASGTTTINLTTGNVHTVTMPAATQTLAISNEVAGQCFIVEINNVTSQGALTWFSTIRWAGGSAPTLTGTNGKRDVFGFRVTGTDTYDGFIVGQNL